MILKKKLIGAIVVAVMAMAMFFSTNTINNTDGDLNLASLVKMIKANAEEDCDLTPAERAAECNFFCNHVQYFTCDILYLCGNGWATIRCVDGDYQ